MENTQKGHFYPFKIVAAVALIMAAVMFTGTPLGTLVHAANGKYIKNTVMISAPSAEEAGKIAAQSGYTLNTDAIYEGNQKTFIGYQTTDNGAEAITDIKAMNMHGGFSYDEYKEHLNEMKDKAKKDVAVLMIAVNEFREEYKKNKDKENIKIAYEVLNRIKDTDLKDNNGLADIMLKDDFSVDELAKYYLQGNASYISMLELCLIIACSYTNDVNFIENLNNFEFTYDYDSSEFANYSPAILNQLKNIKSSVEFYEKSGVTAEGKETEEQLEEFEQEMKEYMDTLIDDPGFDPDKEDNGGLLSGQQKKIYYSTGANIYGLIKDVPYKTDKNKDVKTLLDFVTSDLDLYAIEDFYPLISGMSAGQIALISAGLDQEISMAYTDFDTLKARYEKYLKDAEVDENTEYDLYYNVNRRIYDPSGIAMTSSALREAAKGKKDWAKESKDISKEMAACKKASYFVGTLAPLAALGIYWILDAVIIDYPESALAQFGTGPLWAITLAIVALCIIAAIILRVLAETKPFDPKINKWLDIPAILCSKEQKNGKTIFVYYDAVKNTNGDLMDVGLKESQSKDRQWLELYTTTDVRMGKPIMTDSFKLLSNAKAGQDTKFATLFGGSAAVNLNNFNSCSKKVYINYKNDLKYVRSTATKASSVFSKASSWGFAAAGLAIGLVGGTLIGTSFKRKKQEAPEQ